ncbi:hypothetical protein [Ramlibacter humi]|uniref:Uncharacterized protein n=1 Tax=Ramlibacter humi TaxID=2530451 RepID=A0A4Z0BG24_9BURK|nr:hypothetical protein [Ramlibacter humi]TFY97740.1 hypothetical protein EZ216_18665 [Ramlibacter humi]
MNSADILWFKTQFAPAMRAAVAGTPLTADFLTAIACQETGSIWARLRRDGLAPALIASLCVGDTLDDDRGRKAFPRNYFLDREWATFEGSLRCCVDELRRALDRLGFATRVALTDLELAAVGIAYNTGGYNPAKGLKQGYFDGQRHCGEAVFDYLRAAHSAG